MSILISMYTCSFVLYCLNLMQNDHGNTPLFAASKEGRYDPAALLIKHRADVNYLNKVRPSMVNMVEWCAQF